MEVKFKVKDSTILDDVDFSITVMDIVNITVKKSVYNSDFKGDVEILNLNKEIVGSKTFITSECLEKGDEIIFDDEKHVYKVLYVRLVKDLYKGLYCYIVVCQ